MPEKGVYMNMFISPELNQVLQDSPYKRSEYFRRAIALYESAVTARKDGNSIAILDKEGNILQEIIGI